MIFVDTSAIIAMFIGEADAGAFREELARASRRLTSPAVRLETCMVFSRMAKSTPADAEGYFDEFVQTAEIEEVAIDEAVGRLAVSCFETYGKGRHAARLNYADCLSYACAKAYGARLLYKGDDFSLTDVNDFA